LYCYNNQAKISSKRYQNPCTENNLEAEEKWQKVERLPARPDLKIRSYFAHKKISGTRIKMLVVNERSLTGQKYRRFSIKKAYLMDFLKKT